jgi:hypothetical protein
MKYLVLFLVLFSFNLKGQELWQLQPWASDSTYVIGAMATGEPQWITISGVATKIDSIEFDSDTLYLYTPDTTFKAEIISGGGSGTVKGTGINNKVALWASSDSLKYDSLYFNPTNHIFGLGTDSPAAVGGSFGMHIAGSSFATYRLTNSTGGHTASDGQNIYSYADTLYISNLENGAILFATNSSERVRFDANGLKVQALKSGGSAPTTSGTLVKLVSDANGQVSFQTNNTGTVTSAGLTTGTSGTDVNVSGSPITSSGTITLNIPTASGTNTGKLLNTDWTLFNNKQDALVSGTNIKTVNSNSLLGSGNISVGTLSSLNGLTGATQTFSVTTNAAGFGITSSGTNHAFNLPYQEALTGIRLGVNSENMNNGLAVGNNAGDADCNNCTALGKDVLSSASSGASNNVGIGFQSLYSLTTGYDNFGIGNYSQYYNQTGLYNVSIGTSSLLNNVSGSSNVCIGRLAGRDILGSNNICIGSTAGYLETGSDKIYIGNLLTGNQSSARFGINTAIGSLARTLHVTGEARITDLVTDNPTFLMGPDNDGDLARITVGTGLLLSGTTLNVSGVGIDSTIVTEGWGIDVTESPLNTFTVKADTSQLATQHDISDLVREARAINTTSPLQGGGNLTTDRTLSISQANTTTSGYITNTDWNIFNDKPNGSGASGRVTWWNGVSSLSSDPDFFWDNTNKRMGIGTITPSANLHVTGNVRIEGGSGTPINLMGRNATGLVNQVSLGSGFTISSGILNYSETGNGTVTSIATGNGITGGTITTTGTLGLTGRALALHNLTSTGLITQTGAGSYAGRSIAAGTGISVANGDGVSGNPTITNTGDLSTTNELQTLSWSTPQFINFPPETQ